MKKVMMLMLLFGMVSFGMAQPGNGKRERGTVDLEKRMNAAKEKLNLSDEQFEEWKAVHEKYGEELKEAMDTRDREKGKEIHDKMEQELSAILTDEQKVQFEEMKKEKPRKGRRKG